MEKKIALAEESNDILCAGLAERDVIIAERDAYIHSDSEKGLEKDAKIHL